jgi:hypothetical protein
MLIISSFVLLNENGLYCLPYYSSAAMSLEISVGSPPNYSRLETVKDRHGVDEVLGSTVPPVKHTAYMLTKLASE